MNDLERRALMGDRMAQKKYTILGTALPCPCCKGNAGVCFDLSAPEETPYCCSCFDCGLMVYGKTEREALDTWNTRPVPPIGRCKDCDYGYPSDTEGCVVCVAYGCTVENENFCKQFEPKED